MAVPIALPGLTEGFMYGAGALGAGLAALGIIDNKDAITDAITDVGSSIKRGAENVGRKISTAMSPRRVGPSVHIDPRTGRLIAVSDATQVAPRYSKLASRLYAEETSDNTSQDNSQTNLSTTLSNSTSSSTPELPKDKKPKEKPDKPSLRKEFKEGASKVGRNIARGYGKALKVAGYSLGYGVPIGATAYGTYLLLKPEEVKTPMDTLLERYSKKLEELEKANKAADILSRIDSMERVMNNRLVPGDSLPKTSVTITPVLSGDTLTLRSLVPK